MVSESTTKVGANHSYPQSQIREIWSLRDYYVQGTVNILSY